MLKEVEMSGCGMREPKQRTWENIQERNEEIAKEIMHLCNVMGNEHSLEKAFVEELLNEHPTIQQTFMGVVRRIILMYGQQRYTDLRNQASYDWAKKVREMEEADTEFCGFPFI